MKLPLPHPLIQFPNLPLAIAIAGWLVAHFTTRYPHRLAVLVSVMALAIWGYGEITAGVNWFRRILGIIGLVSSLMSCLMLAR